MSEDMTDNVVYNDAEREPVLSVDVINKAFAELKRSYVEVRTAAIMRYELERTSYNMLPEGSKVKVMEAEADCALNVAKAEVDRLNMIQTFFQMASLNNLADTYEE